MEVLVEPGRTTVTRFGRAATTALLVLAIAAACGGDSGTGPDEDPNGDPNDPNYPWLANGSMSALTNGDRWRASQAVQALVTPGSSTTSELLLITGVDTVGRGMPNRRVLLLTLHVYPKLAPGSYGLGVNHGGGAPGTVVSAASIMDGNALAHWITPFSVGETAGAGTITLTTVTPSRVAGTFSYTANADDPANPDAQIQVTQGVFDIETSAP